MEPRDPVLFDARAALREVNASAWALDLGVLSGGLRVEAEANRPAVAVFEGADRYRLLLVHGATSPPPVVDVGFVLLNPSTADAFRDDPTIRRVKAFASRTAGLGAHVVAVANLYAYRATKPTALSSAMDPIGPRNEAVLRWMSERCRVLVVGFGANREVVDLWHNRAVAMLRGPRGRELVSLGSNKDGSPRHPLYVGGSVPLTVWRAPWE